MDEDRFFSPYADDNIRHLLSFGRELTRDEVIRATLNAGRNSAPRIVFALHHAGRLPVDVVQYAAPDAWCSAEFPQSALRQQDWRSLFEYAGYTHNGVATDRPDAPITLYRGAPRNYRLRWAWSGTKAMAERFAANRAYRFGVESMTDYLWTAVVEPGRLYAHISGEDFGRDEDEYVIDTRGLKVRPIEFGAIADLSRQRMAGITVSEPVATSAATRTPPGALGE